MLKVQAWLWASAVITPPLVAFGDFDGLQGPRLRPAFEATEPWCRQGKTERTARPCGSGGIETWAPDRRGGVLAG